MELLIGRAFYLTTRGERAVLHTQPRRLGSTIAQTHFQAWLDLQIDPRAHGHSSIVLYHFVYDRAVLKPLFRLQRQYFQARYLRAKGLRHTADAELAWVQTLLTSAECYNHSAHTALEWAFMQYVRDVTVLKSMFITVESLRRGYSEIMSHLPQWLGLRLQFEDSRQSIGCVFGTCAASSRGWQS